MLQSLGAALGDDAPVDAAAVSAGVTRAGESVMSFGKAQVGDKTMIDAIVPFVDALTGAVGAGRGLGEAWQDAADVAAQAARDTAQLTAKLGRARSHGDKSIGTPDPGAVSFAMIATTVSAELERAAAAAEEGD
jgi:dihydroxyacetone kinase